jgi:hypothetical protein
MNTPVMMCNMDFEWTVPGSLAGNTSAATCKALYAKLLAAQISERSVTVFFDGDDVPGACTNFAAWKTANVRYLE